jgi:hypothetical protein
MHAQHHVVHAQPMMAGVVHYTLQVVELSVRVRLGVECAFNAVVTL